MKKIFISLVSIALLSGCTSAGGTASGTSSPSSVQSVVASESTQSASPAQSASPVQSASPTPSLLDETQWFLTGDGYGPLVMGKPQPAGYKYTPEQGCATAELLNKAGKPMVDFGTDKSGNVSLIFAGEKARTAEGIGTGSSVADAKKAYPNAEQRSLDGIPALLVPGKNNTVLVIELGGEGGTVGFITVQKGEPIARHLFECEESN